MTDTPLWTPDKTKASQTRLAHFMKECGQEGADYDSFWRWSVENSEKFWDRVWDFTGIVGEKGKIILKDGDKMPGGRFFPDGKINYAENLLKKRDETPAIIFRDELGREKTITFNDVYDQVSLWQQALSAAGVKEGDRVAAFMPNMPETIIACLATTSLGAIWSSASPDFGVQGLIDRFGQIEPKVFIAVDGYFYGGKTL